MIYSCIEMVELELDYLTKLKNNLRKFLQQTKRYENTYLNVEERRGLFYYHKVVETDGQRKRSYVGKCDNPTVVLLHKRAYAKRALAVCERNIQALSRLVSAYKSLEPEEVIKSAGKAYRQASAVAYELLDVMPRNDWLASEERNKKEDGEFRPEDLRHISADGKGKRSKGEVIIANILLALNACYVYEPVRIINGKKYRPDFAVYNDKTGEEILIEYMGMLYDEDYRGDAHRKIENYIVGGYTLGKDLIIFMDNEDGNIDSCKIEKVIRAYLA